MSKSGEHSQHYRHRVRVLPRDYVEHPETSDGVVRITNRLFPECRLTEGISGDLSDYRRFHCRFYLPVRPLLERDPKGVDRLFILINGLNEVDWYTLYDQIGTFLARHGVAAVLIPTPDHLVRHTKFRHLSPTADQEKPPIELLLSEEGPSKLFERFVQYMQEIDIFIRHARHEPCRARDADCRFYHQVFAPNVRISTLGYSLGGLGALAVLLRHDTTINAAVLLNAGASLGDIVLPPQMIGRDDWLALVTRIDKSWVRPHANREEAEVFETLFVGQTPERLHQWLADHTGRIMLVVGGADSVVTLQSIAKIEPPGHGLHLLKIPGLSHFLFRNPRWDQWLEIALDAVLRFDAEAGADRWTESEIVGRLARYQKRFGIIAATKDRLDARGVQEPTERKQVEDDLQVARCLLETEVALAEAVLDAASKLP